MDMYPKRSKRTEGLVYRYIAYATITITIISTKYRDCQRLIFSALSECLSAVLGMHETAAGLLVRAHFLC